jgi:predicted regulator of Ras-like GTPase activity (Roadblock/LC7/MglB family)
MKLDEAAAGVPGLLHLVVFSAEGLLIHFWTRLAEADGEELAVEFARLHSVAGEVLDRTGPNRGPQWVTVEAPEGRLLLGRVSAQLRVGVQFDRSWPLGLVRAQARQLAELARAFEDSEGEIEAVRALIEAVRRRSPDAEAVLSHMARSAGISVLDLARPELLSPDQAQAVLAAVPHPSHARTPAGLED